MPRILIDHADRQPVFGIGARIQVLHKQLFAAQRSHNAVKQRVKLLRAERLVVVAPVHQFGGNRVFDCEFVFYGTPGVFPGIGHDGAVVSQQPFAPAYGMFHQNAGVQVAMDFIVLEKCFQG